jgi:hypothetical protein
MKRTVDHWAHRELEKRLGSRGRAGSARANQVQEIGTVFLVDPEMSQAIDEIISRDLWPAVTKGLKGSRIKIYDRRKVLSQITSKWEPVLTRQLVFLLEDPMRPVASSERPLWYVRFRIEANISTYMMNSDLILGLPKSLDLLRLIVLMEHPSLIGLPPNLVVDDEDYVVTFSWGLGGPYHHEAFDPEVFIIGKIREHLQIIEAANRLELAIDDEDAFQLLSNRILEAYAGRSF